MNRRAFVTGLGAALVAPQTAAAQPAGKVARIGFLEQGASPSSADSVREAFRRQLRELGYIEGQNVVFEYRFAEGRAERLPDFAADLIRLKMDVIVGGGTLGPLAAKRATSTIPIVMAAAGDPLGTGLVMNLAKPGGNVTGLSNLSAELTAKRLQLMKDIVPGLSRVAILWNSANPISMLVMRHAEAAARDLALRLQSVEVRNPDDFDNVLLNRTRIPWTASSQ